MLNSSPLLEEKIKVPQVSYITGVKRHTLNARIKSIFEGNSINRGAGNQILLTPEQVKILIDDKLNKVRGKVVYIGNLKGGVGKTTIAYLLTSSLIALGLKVCAIDLDIQANLTSQYIDVYPTQPVFYDVIDEKVQINDVIINITKNFDLIPSSLKNSLIQKALSMQQPKHHLSWLNSICLEYLRTHYDVVIVDTPPNLNTLNSVFCLCLTDNDHILIPVCADDFSIMGVQMFLDDILEIRRSYNIATDTNISIIMNRFFQQQKNNLEMLIKTSQAYQGMVSEIIIRDSAKIREAVTYKTPFSAIKGAEIYEVIKSLLCEINILKKDD